MGAKGSVRTFENLLGVWVRTDIQLPPQRCTGDGSTLMPLSDTQRHGTRQGCKAGRLLLDSRVVDVPMAYNPTFVTLSSLKPFFFNGLKNELRFLDNVGA